MTFRLAILLLLAACDNDTDPRWQLHHDRIIAIRATPSHVPAGEQTALDAFVTSVDAGPAVTAVSSVSPVGDLGGATITHDADTWRVTAPTSDQIAALRVAQGVTADAPVEIDVEVVVQVGAQPLVAIKELWFGDARDNPEVGPVTIGGAPPTDPIVVPFDVDVALEITTDAANLTNWLTSCGSLDRDDNEHAALLHVKPADRTSGDFGVVVRDPFGGVAWSTWKIASTP